MQKIAYFAPLGRAFRRMQKILFAPFSFTKWLVLGFTAWLANLCEGGGVGSFGNADWDKVADNLPHLKHDLTPEVITVVIIVAAVVLVAAVAVVLVVTWINSRGKFIFLDNVVHDKAEIKAPWRRFKVQGNSLFLWRIVFGLIVFLVVAAIVAVLALSIVPYIRSRDMFLVMIIGGSVSMLLMIAAVIALAYVNIFLKDFVVPVMYKYNLKTNEAWRMLLPLIQANAGKFILYGLFLILVVLGVIIVILTVVVLTCCIAGCLILIPYVGSVVLLPISVLMRALGPEFLRQFSPDFDVFPPEGVPQAPAAAMPSYRLATPPME
jgi:hypothetical protein